VYVVELVVVPGCLTPPSFLYIVYVVELVVVPAVSLLHFSIFCMLLSLSFSYKIYRNEGGVRQPGTTTSSKTYKI
jgi:hypothetical protein